MDSTESPATRISPYRLLLIFSQITLSGFGGAMFWARRRLVEQKLWITDREFVEFLTLGQLLPGPPGLNLTVLVGYRLGGWAGAVAAVGGFVGWPFLVVMMQALLDSANAVLATQFTLTAPFDGTIVAVDVAPSETVVPGRTVIEMGDLSSYVIETTDLSERDVTRVRIGQPASVFIEALDREFSGKVKDVALISTTIGGDVVYKVTLELDDRPEGLLWGMSADVAIEPAD